MPRFASPPRRRTYRIWGFFLLAAPVLAACAVRAQPSTTPSTRPASTPVADADPTPAAPRLSLPEVRGMSTRAFTSVSPDHQWRAEAQLASFPGEVPYEYERVTITRTDLFDPWVAHERLEEYGGLGWGYLSAFQWSADGRYLYFRHTAASDGCGYPFTTELHRVDLATRQVRAIPLTGMLFGEISMAPEADRMAYRAEQGLVLVDLPTGDSRTVPHPWPEGFGYLVGWSGWSPDGRELAFQITSPLCDSPEASRSSVTVIDLETGATRTPSPRDTWVYLPAEIVADPVPTAALALNAFLDSLYWGSRGEPAGFSYERAVALYGGSYQTLAEVNPGLDPGDRVGLLRSACEANGYRCLRLRDVIYSTIWWEPDGALAVQFEVHLQDSRGGLFALGPCCGEENRLPQTTFSFTVRQSEGGIFQVLDLPQYSP